jgi:hypothetical protein
MVPCSSTIPFSTEEVDDFGALLEAVVDTFQRGKIPRATYS